MGKDCGWKHSRAPAVRKMWKEKATEAVLEFLEDKPAGRWLSAGVRELLGRRWLAKALCQGAGGGGPGPP